MDPPNVGPQIPPPPRKLPNPNPVRTVDIPRLTDAALAKLLAAMQRADKLRPDQNTLLQQLKAEADRREFRRRHGIEVDPSLVPDIRKTNRELMRENPALGGTIDWIASLLDSADDTSPTIPAKPWEIFFEKVIGLPAVPVEVFIKFIGGADPANSGTDEMTAEQLRRFFARLNEQERRALLAMLNVANSIRQGGTGVVPMDKRDP
jgi:hypothetical protein